MYKRHLLINQINFMLCKFDVYAFVAFVFHEIPFRWLFVVRAYVGSQRGL